MKSKTAITRVRGPASDGDFAIKYGLKPFGELQTSTATVMVYTNVIFDTKRIFETIKLTDIEVPLTKKQKNVDKKKITAPYGTIISVQSKTHIRGVDLRKKKRHWCTICQPVVNEDGEDIEIKTVTEELELVPDTDIMAIMYHCSKCKKSYQPSAMKKINHFLNQITIVLSIGSQPLLNIMMFRDNLKFAGCKDVADAEEAILVLWEDYICNPSEISPFAQSIRKGGPLWKLKEGETEPRFVYETVMRNVDFKIGWPLERPALNYLMNSEKYSEYVFMSQYEPTGHTNVNIKMYSRKPVDFQYDCLVIPLKGQNMYGKPYFISLPDIPYKSEKKKIRDEKTQKYITFIAFSSSEIILSGRYNKNMEEMYNFFVKTVFSHRKQIEEKLEDADIDEIEEIKKTRGRKIKNEA